jgi:hypothetical protein
VRTYGVPSIPQYMTHHTYLVRHTTLYSISSLHPGTEPDIVIRDPAPPPLCDTDLADESVSLPDHTHVWGEGCRLSTHCSVCKEPQRSFSEHTTNGPRTRTGTDRMGMPPTHYQGIANKDQIRSGMAMPPTPSRQDFTARMGVTWSVGVTAATRAIERVGITAKSEQQALRQCMMDYFRNGGATELVQLVTRVRAMHAACSRIRDFPLSGLFSTPFTRASHPS